MSADAPVDGMAADDGRDPLDVLAERFLSRWRSGERVEPEAFAAEHPEHHDALLDLLPTLLALEQVKRDRESTGRDRTRLEVPQLDRVGDFRIERELGRGGMGVVFEAVQESLERRVALKVIPQAALLGQNQLARFRREAQIAAKLHHTHIVPVYDSGVSDGYHWYAMQYIAGQSLDRWRETQAGHAPEGSGAWRSRARFVARLGAEAASALGFAHASGTLHRDVKPGNFLLDKDDHLWVTDFGLAKALETDGLTRSGDVLGTLQYMAPEQFAGRYDARSEVYALGVTLYELLTLRPAYRGTSRTELMHAVQAQRFEPLAKLCPELPRDIVVIVEKAMARDPQDRYPTAQALQEDLEAFLADRPIQARPLSSAALLLRWCRRNRGMASLAAATVAAVLGAAITGWVAYGVTGEALTREQEASQLARNESERAERNLRRALAAFGDVFDALAGRDPLLAVDEDPDTGEATFVLQSQLGPRDVALLQELLAFYDQFASDNADSQSLRYETARAYRRVGAIRVLLGDPESLVAAEAALHEALRGFAGVTDRDVQRDIATVHVDLGHMYERRGRTEAAGGSLQQALNVLEQLADADAPSNQLLRARVLYDLARQGRGRPPRGARGPDHLEQALALVDALLRRDAGDPEVLALKARCLLLQVRGPRARADSQAVVHEAVAILRELVAKRPDRPDFRFDLCEAALALQPQAMRRLGGRRPGAAPTQAAEPGEISAAVQSVVDLLTEADGHAAKLFVEQPLFTEFRALHGRTRSSLGQLLLAVATVGPAASRDAARQAARAKLESALDVELGLLEGEGQSNPRYVRQVLATLGALAVARSETDDVEGAKQLVVRALDLLEQQVPQRARREPEPGAGPGGRGRPSLGPRREDRLPLPLFEAVLRRLDDPALDERVERLRQRLRGR